MLFFFLALWSCCVASIHFLRKKFCSQTKRKKIFIPSLHFFFFIFFYVLPTPQEKMNYKIFLFNLRREYAFNRDGGGGHLRWKNT